MLVTNISSSAIQRQTCVSIGVMLSVIGRKRAGGREGGGKEGGREGREGGGRKRGGGREGRKGREGKRMVLIVSYIIAYFSYQSLVLLNTYM